MRMDKSDTLLDSSNGKRAKPSEAGGGALSMPDFIFNVRAFMARKLLLRLKQILGDTVVEGGERVGCTLFP